MADAPSGGSGESQPWAAVNTLSAGSIARAPPPQPWPRMTDTVGTSTSTSSPRVRAIEPAMACSSAVADSSAPGVSIMDTRGIWRECARVMPRRANRRAAGPSSVSACGGWWCRSWPMMTTGRLAMRVSATLTAGEIRPSPEPESSITLSEPSAARRCCSPGRSARRVAVMASQALMGGWFCCGCCIVGLLWLAGVRSTLASFWTAARSCLGEITPSITPCCARCSPCWTPAGMVFPVVSSTTRGPRKPRRAPGSAKVMCPADPQDAMTPPVVGLRRYTIKGRWASLCR